MFRRMILSIALVAILAMSQIGAAQATPVAPSLGKCTENTIELGNGFQTIYLVCMPLLVPWNYQLVVFAHGYVPNLSATPILPKDQLDAIGGVNLADTINRMGYAFAMTSYPVNGLAILPGVLDVVNLVQYFKAGHPGTTHVFLTGASEGGLVTTLTLERNPGVFKGGYAVCGPIGSWQNQVNHFGDFRVLFDYYFPGIMPVTGDPLHPGPTDDSAIYIPDYLPLTWDQGPLSYPVKIGMAIQSNPGAAKELYKVAKVPVDPLVPASSAVQLLWYNAFATMDARAKLSLVSSLDPSVWLNPYDNNRRYFGSSNDMALNTGVPRFTRTVPTMVMKQYDTSGKLAAPLVTMHTTGDPIVPYSHEMLYTLKTLQNGTFFKRLNIPVSRYGHCAFTAKEVIFGFAMMIYKATGTLPLTMVSVLADGGETVTLSEQEFRQMEKDYSSKNIYIPMIGN